MMSWTELEARSVNNFSGLGGGWTSSSIRGDHSTPQGPGNASREISLLQNLRLERTRKCLSRTARRTVCSSWRLQR